MLTLNTIIKEIKDVPIGRLEELYQFVHSLSPKIKPSERERKKIMSFAGLLSDMSSEDYSEFLDQTRKARTELFDRKIEL